MDRVTQWGIFSRVTQYILPQYFIMFDLFSPNQIYILTNILLYRWTQEKILHRLITVRRFTCEIYIDRDNEN